MTDEHITAYLLDELTQREAEEFEKQCFAQTEWPEVDLESAEEDLIQAYLKNELGPERRQRFQEKYLTTAAREDRVLLAQSFLRVACSASAPTKVTWKQRLRNFLWPEPFSPAALLPRLAAVVLVVGLVVILITLIFRTRTPHTFAELHLVMKADTRGAGPQATKVTLPLAEDALRISLALPETAPAGSTYRVQWEDVKGPIEDVKIDKQDSNSITVIIPADKLKPGQYTLKLYRKNPDGTEQRLPGNYLFEVE